MIGRDFRHTLRQMRRSPGYTMLVMLLLAVGIGATTAVFGLVNGVILRPLPYGDANRLVVVWEDLLHEGNHTFSVAPLNATDVAAQRSTFSEVALQMTGGGMTLKGHGPAQMIRPGIVTGNFFDVVSSRAAIGRALTPDDERTHARVVVLSDQIWHDAFARDPRIVGSTIDLDDARYTVVGVMPASFESPWVFKAPHMNAALWTPLTIPPSANDRESAMLQVIARLRPGVTASDAQRRLNTLASHLANAFPATNKDVAFNVVPMRDQIVGKIRMPLLLLLGGIVTLLLVACANIAALVLQRTNSRRHELAVRVAIGASRWQIARQLITENATLAVLGGAMGSVIGIQGTRILVALAPSETPRLTGAHADTRVLLFSAGATLLVAVALSLAPAVRTTRNIGGQLRASRGARDRLRSGFAFVQVALAVTLIISGSLFMRSFARLTSVNPGFVTHNVFSVRVGAPAAHYASPAQQAAFFEAALERVAAIPGVAAAGVTSRPPLDPPFGYTSVRIAGQEVADNKDLVGYRVVTPDYLDALQVPLHTGRMISGLDRSGSARAAVVNEAFAAKYSASLHDRIIVGNDTAATIEVVGIVGNVSNGAFDAAPIPEMFVPLAQDPVSAGTLITRTTGDVSGVQKAIQEAVMSIDRDVVMQEARTMDEIAATAVALPRFSAYLTSLFALLAMTLAAIGIYGIFAQSVVSRTREIGIRTALGAPALRLVSMMVAEAVAVTAAGTAAGIGGALLLARAVQTQLFGIAATDATTIAQSVAAMLLIAAIACIPPTRRLLRLDPASVMRSD